MTSDRLFERDLPEMLAQLGSAPAPDYRDDIVQRTATMRQRPAWSFPTRRLPMPAITGGLPRVPVRVAAVVALGLLLLAILAVLAIGARPNLPAPFGPARNGLVAYARDGDISVADPRTGKERAVVAGPETDIRPIFSRDGTRLAFERKTPNDLRSGRIYVVAIDGSGLTEVTREPLSMTPRPDVLDGSLIKARSVDIAEDPDPHRKRLALLWSADDYPELAARRDTHNLTRLASP